MPQPHFVTSYERHVRTLTDKLPHDEAMEQAVGGHFAVLGALELELLLVCGFGAGNSIIDIGCGSGRLAGRLGQHFGDTIDYLGTDVVQSLLDHAARQCPSSYRFALHHDLSVPAPDGSTDFIAAFSVFTHLFHEETFCYLRDAKRALKPGGAIVLSFLEMARHWDVFQSQNLDPTFLRHRPSLNMFIERPAIDAWAEQLGLTLRYDIAELGQSVAVLRKPA